MSQEQAPPAPPAAGPDAAGGDSDALDRIAELLRADADGEWGPYLPDAIGEIVRGTGRSTGSPA